MKHSDRLTWDNNGKCYYRVPKSKRCEGTPGYSGGCPGSYMDNYGSRQSCNECRGSGVIRYEIKLAVPQFDAPRPPASWVPDWVES